MKWENGWPVINPGRDEVQFHYPFPIKPLRAISGIQYSGNMKIRDDFTAEVLNRNWVFLRTPKEQWYNLKQREGFLSIKLRPESCSGLGNPSFLGHRQQNLSGYASIAMFFSPEAENEKAGLLIFQNENHFYFFCKSLEGSESVIQLYKSGNNEHSENSMKLITSHTRNVDQRKKELYFKIDANGNIYSFLYGLEPDRWNVLKDSIDAAYLSTRVAGGFVGCLYAMYATSLGKPSTTVSYFDWFEYQGKDEVYGRYTENK